MATQKDAFTLSQEQQAAVDSTAKRLCILACAGSGKTTTLTRRISRLINDNGVDPSKVAAITFTVLAGDNLKYELSRVLKDRSATAQMFVGTIHSFCLQLLFSERTLSAEAFEPITEAQQFVLLNKNLSRWNIQDVDPDSDKSSIIERLMSSFDIIKMNGIAAHDLRTLHPEVARVFDLYNNYLVDNGFVDFADMLTKARDLLLTDNEARAHCFERFPYVFVDEYQDVDPIQADIVNIFARSADVCVVGDDDQAIYQFRGADERNIQDFSVSEGCTTSPLSENRRCPQNVLAVAEGAIGQISRRLPKSMYTKTASGQVFVKQFESLRDELDYLATAIKSLLMNHSITSYAQVGILLRSMASYGSIYVDSLRAAGIPCIARGARTLFSTSEITQLVAIIEWFAKDADGLEQLAELSPVFSTAVNTGLLPAVERSSLLTKRDFRTAGFSDSDWLLFTRLQELRTRYEERKFGSLLELVHRFIEELDIFSPGYDALAKHNVAQFTRIMGEYEKIQDNKDFRSLAAFLASYARNSYDEVNPPDIQADAVSVLTVHQAKGLEFDFVFLPMLVEERFPLEHRAKRWLIDDSLFDSARYKTSLDNERRLFYVACTRARKSLHLLASRDVGLKKPKSPSLFFVEASRTKMPDANEVPTRPDKVREDNRFLVAGYSSLEYYLTCPYRYQVIAEYGLEFPQNVFFQFGKLMHDVLANINGTALSGQPLTLDEAKSFLEQDFPRYYKNTNMRQYDIRKQQLRAEQVIETYYAKQADWVKNLVGIEGDLAYATGRALIKGRYDALIRNERGKHTIIDYKTGHPHAGLRTDFQMQFYALAVDAQLHVEVDEAIVYYIEADKPTVFTVTPRFLREGEERLTKTIDGILSRSFSPTPNKEVCTQCEVRRICTHKAQ